MGTINALDAAKLIKQEDSDAPAAGPPGDQP